MIKKTFIEQIRSRWAEGKFICVGLDSELNKIPFHVQNRNASIGATILDFNKSIIKETKDLVCCYKPNVAFYEEHGIEGHYALIRTIKYIHEFVPGVPVILDAKRGDIGNTNNCYVKAAFDSLEADAITIFPYMGREAMQPFLDRKDKGIIRET